ncbi:hypothetical protein [uncultured Massilia sp.]|uniref:hypothetical protein n=1 Tax=uncultured Massilia sp. TaxID=169973 RepID=UPI0025E2B60E|nr:hypothetical protein [uncultured Massilia sp.]
METTLRPTNTSGAVGAARPGSASRLVPARVPEQAPADDGAAAATATADPKPLQRTTGNAGGAAMQDGVARAQQAIDYLDRVATQLESLKSQLTAKLAGSRAGTAQQQPQIDTHARQLASTLAARKKDGGGGLDANLNFSAQPATQRFRIRALDIDALQQSAPQTISFSIGNTGGPQMAATITQDQSTEEAARAIDRAIAPMGVRASLDDGGALVFSTAESNWPAIKDSIAVSGRGRVATEEVPVQLAPQQWNSSNTDGLRQSLREVVQALERVHRSQDAASNALSAATVEYAASQTPPPEVEIAADEFASAAAGTDYESLLSLTSALVGVSRERVLALLGLR